jgi:eukaryotic-like serine/threonine-protein kinase
MTTPRLLSERYELGETLGYGGMSEVHKGLDTRLGRDVAIKVLRADLARDPQFQMRFRREAQNAASLNHPAIVSVYDTGETQGEFGPLPYIVMEYVDGQTLREIIKSTGQLSQQRVIEVMADVCAALDFSHRHQIIHRDVKPANIMINRAGAVKVMDFGIARALGEGQNVTQTAAVIGTAQYLSPEQARGEAVDARSDVYAAGCVLYELLTGEPPFTGDTPVAVAYQHVREDPKAPSEVNPNVPPELDAVVLKALSKNPANRYQSAGEMRSDLVRVRSGQAPLAPAVMSHDERTAMMANNPSTGPTRRINGNRHATPPPPRGGYDDYDRGGYDEYDKPSRSVGKTVGIVVGVLVALGLIGFAAYQIFGGAATPQQFQLANLAGQTEQDARNSLIGQQLQVNVRNQESQASDLGKVISTDPPAGSLVQARSTVTLVLGSGPATVTIPDISGSTVDEATQKLKTIGLTVGNQTQQQTSDSTKVGKVITTDPGPGKSVAGGSPVNLTVGVQATGVQIPDFSGQKVGDVRNAIESLGLQQDIADGSDGSSDTTVTGTNPPAGTSVPKGSTVEIITNGDNASGSGKVPSVTGLTLSAAQAKLNQAGYTNITADTTSTNDPSKVGTVAKQSPKSGSSADPSKEIKLTVYQSGGGSSGNGNNSFGNNFPFGN